LWLGSGFSVVRSQVTGQAYLGLKCPLTVRAWDGGQSVWVSSTGSCSDDTFEQQLSWLSWLTVLSYAIAIVLQFNIAKQL